MNVQVFIGRCTLDATDICFLGFTCPPQRWLASTYQWNGPDPFSFEGPPVTAPRRHVRYRHWSCLSPHRSGRVERWQGDEGTSTCSWYGRDRCKCDRYLDGSVLCSEARAPWACCVSPLNVVLHWFEHPTRGTQGKYLLTPLFPLPLPSDRPLCGSLDFFGN